MVTGASTGIGFELAKRRADHGLEPVIVGDEPRIERAADELRPRGVGVEAVVTDLATPEGVDDLCAAIRRRPVEEVPEARRHRDRFPPARARWGCATG